MRCWYHGLPVDGTHGIPRPRALFSGLVRRLLPLCALAGCAGSGRVLEGTAHLRLDAVTAALAAPIDAVTLPDALAWAPLADGHRVTVTADGARITDVRGAVTEAHPLRDASRCVPRAWRDRAVIFCRDEGLDARSLPSPLPRLVVLRGDAEGWIASRDGLSLTREGPCDAETPADATLTACSFEDGRWREWRTDAAGALLDRYGSLALVTRCVGDAPCDVWLYDIDLARWHPTRLPDATSRWTRVGFDPDGRLAGVAHSGARDGVPWFVVGPPGASLRALRLPEDVDDVAVGARGVAVFLRGESAWFTDGDGRTLRPVRGCALHPTAPVALRRAGHSVACEAGECAIDARCGVGGGL